MLAIDEIEKLLNDLQDLYDENTKSPVQQKYYSKLALLELCGWLEYLFDDIAYGVSIESMSDSADMDDLDRKIKAIYGCSYEHLRSLLTICVGLPRLLSVEEEFTKTGELEILKSHLDSLWGMRKPAAHTSMVGRTEQFQTPTVLLVRLKGAYIILDRLNKAFSKK